MSDPLDKMAEQPAQQQEETDAFDDDIEVIGLNEIRTRYRLEKGTKLYTSPPAQRKPLTDKEIEVWAKKPISRIALCRAIEAAHGIKENT